MKTILAALAVTLAVAVASIPASAGYVDPTASKLQQALSVGAP